MSDSLTLSPPRQSGPPPTLEARALFRMNAAALHDAPAPQSGRPVVVLVAGERGDEVAIAQTAEIVVLAEVRAKARSKRPDR
ncbi:MAG: hypothetical protein JNJ73_00645 [Hyphomonadaceae bacterium]|nr:hypothetical protein [Hyphomonadaceae bacterium]